MNLLCYGISKIILILSDTEIKLLEKLWWISLNVTDGAIEKL